MVFHYALVILARPRLRIALSVHILRLLSTFPMRLSQKKTFIFEKSNDFSGTKFGAYPSRGDAVLMIGDCDRVRITVSALWFFLC